MLNHSIRARDSKAIIRILEFWRNAGASRAARDFDVMAPRASARRLARRLHWAHGRSARVPLWRNRVIIRVVPIAAPFVDVVADVVKSECIRRVTSHRFGTIQPARRVVGQGLRWLVSPGKLFLLQASTGGVFPFRLGRKTKVASSLRSQPFTVADRFVPRDSRNWLLRMIEVRIVPEPRRCHASRAQEPIVLRIRDLRRHEAKRIDPYAMNWPFAVLAGIGTYQEPPGRNLNESGFEHGWCELRRHCSQFSNRQKFPPQRAQRNTAETLAAPQLPDHFRDVVGLE